MKKDTQQAGTTLSRLRRMLLRWFGLRFDLTGLSISDGDILVDLAAGRE